MENRQIPQKILTHVGGYLGVEIDGEWEKTHEGEWRWTKENDEEWRGDPPMENERRTPKGRHKWQRTKDGRRMKTEENATSFL